MTVNSVETVPQTPAPQPLPALDEAGRALLFTEARTANSFAPTPVTDRELDSIWDLAKWPPTAANVQPLRVLYVRAPAGRERLVRHMSDGNKAKTATAPAVAVLAVDTEFHQHIPQVVADYFEAYARKIAAPVRCGVDVKKVERQKGRVGFLVETSHGMFEANSVVAATGPFQCPRVPAVVPDISGVLQIHSVAYRNPDQLPKGAVLIIGAGSSGVQIAEELLLAGKRVYLSVGPHERPPRAYRTRDYCWWLGVLGKWDLETRIPGREHVTISVTGARGGHTIDFRRLAAQGITLLGVTESARIRP